jgi:hypothetical protein
LLFAKLVGSINQYFYFLQKITGVFCKNRYNNTKASLIFTLRMMTVPNRVLLQDLQDKTESILQSVYSWRDIPWAVFSAPATNGGWSAAACLQHLNLYFNYYLPHIKKGLIDKNLWKTHDTVFKSSWLGNYFANAILPKENGEISKMKATKTKQPSLDHIPENVLHSFIQNMEELKSIFSNADRYNINKKIVPVSFISFLKINIGDALRFVVYHNIRHIAQANRVLLSHNQ